MLENMTSKNLKNPFTSTVCSVIIHVTLNVRRRERKRWLNCSMTF